MTFYSTSQQLEQHLPDIDQHWQQAQKGFFNSPFGRLFYTYHIPANATHAVVLVNGRIESAHKYRELLWELSQNRLAVFTFDHPGQGYSERLLPDTQIGYVRRFENYAEALHCFMTDIVCKHTQLPIVLLAHSMGAAISCDYLQLFQPKQVVAGYLSAPMLGINTAPYPTWVAQAIAATACLLGLGKRYAIGQTQYLEKPFADNDLTHCPERYALFRGLYNQYPELQLGGVSFAWLNAALRKCQALQHVNIKVPLRIASAEQDTVVDNLAQRQFAAKQPHTTITSFAGKHELLCEQDSTRKAVLDDFYAFIVSLETAKETGS